MPPCLSRITANVGISDNSRLLTNTINDDYMRAVATCSSHPQCKPPVIRSRHQIVPTVQCCHLSPSHHAFNIVLSLLLVDVEDILVLEEAGLVVSWQRRIAEVDVLHSELHPETTRPLQKASVS